MKLSLQSNRKARIEMLPLIDIVFLVLVFFIYAMLAMAVHRGRQRILLQITRRADTAARRARREEFVEAILSVIPAVPITLTIMRLFGEIDARLSAAGGRSPTSDLRSACTALLRGDEILTGGARHCERVVGWVGGAGWGGRLVGVRAPPPPPQLFVAHTTLIRAKRSKMGGAQKKKKYIFFFFFFSPPKKI